LRILFATTVLPSERRGGGEVVSQAFIDTLRSAGHDVRVLGYRRRGARPPLHGDDVIGGERPIETSRAPVRSAAWLAAAIMRREPASAAKYRSRAYSREARRLLAERPPAAVILDHAQSAVAVRETSEAIPLAYLAHNAEHRLYAELADRATGLRGKVLRRESVRMAALETALVARASDVWTLSDADADALRELGARRTRTFAVPPAPTGPPGNETKIDVALLGNWMWSANAAGLDWFCQRVLPALPERLTVAVAGLGSEGLVARRANAAGLGPIGDAQGFLGSARVIGVPSVAGAGVQIKTLDAIASGREVVATSVAIRGLGELPPTVTIADDADDFAAALAAAASRPPTVAARAAAEWVTARERRFRDQVLTAVADLAA
jgi:hypothetical protein